MAAACSRNANERGHVDTKDGTTSEGFGLPCTACTLNPVPEANKLLAELASEHGCVAVAGITAEELGKGTGALGAALEDAHFSARAACTVCEISATNSGEIAPVAGSAS